MNLKCYIKTLLAGFAATAMFSLSLVTEASTPPRPNILLIMVDDMGYSDLGCYGSTIPTPHIDSLAENGIRYNQFYNAARCCPTRASLLTGLYPHQTGVGWMTAADLGSKGYTGDLNDECRTIAECLRDAGYSTYLSGKWHVSRKKSSWPLQRGFDRFYGMIGGGASYWTPKLTLGNKPVKPGEDYYLTEGITEHARMFLKEHFAQSSDKPFFLYLAHYAPHLPLHARPEDIAKYRGKFKKGWDVLREEKYQRMLEMGIIDSSFKLSSKPKKRTRNWDRLSAEEQEAMDLRMAIYAAQIDSLDRGIGEVIASLKKNNAFENTLILFLSDNGADATFTGRNNKDIATYGTNASKLGYGPSWANYSNIPFRLYKMWVHEGGIASPLIAHWPKGIQPQQKINTQVGHITDLMPTILELAGASYEPAGGKTFPDLVGQSLVPTFSGERYERGPILWEHKGNRALRKGKWKLVADGINGAWELYDMETDRSELTNLADKHPEVVTEMAKQWDEIAKATYVYPLDGRSWGEKIKNPIVNK